MRYSVLAPVLLAALYAAKARAQTICEQLLAGTYQWPERRDLFSEANTTRAVVSEEAPYHRRQDSAPATPSSSATSSSAAPLASSNSTNNTVIWLIEDEYKGDTFFECVLQPLIHPSIRLIALSISKWDFWSDADPTHGTVTLVGVAFIADSLY
jgi:hypothetical protein